MIKYEFINSDAVENSFVLTLSLRSPEIECVKSLWMGFRGNRESKWKSGFGSLNAVSV